MKTLFKSHFRTLVAILLAFLFLTVHVQAKQNSAKFKPSVEQVSKIVKIYTNPIWMADFILPDRPGENKQYANDYKYFENAGKPDNIHYQLVKRKYLNLVTTQLNV